MGVATVAKLFKLIAGYACVLASSAVLAFCLVGFGSVVYAWFNGDPGCDCYAQRIYVARSVWENHRDFIEGSALVVFALSAFGLRKTIFANRFLKALAVGLMAAAAAWYLFGQFYEPSLPSRSYMMITVPKVVGYKYRLLAEMLIEPMFTWKFVFSLGVFLVSLLGAYLLFLQKWVRKPAVIAQPE